MSSASPLGSCELGYGGSTCTECVSGYWLSFSAVTSYANNNVCDACPEHANAAVFGLIVFLTLMCMVLTVMTVKTGVNRKSIHSLVFKLVIAYVSCWPTFEEFVSNALLPESSQAAVPGSPKRLDESDQSPIVRVGKVMIEVGKELVSLRMLECVPWLAAITPFSLRFQVACALFGFVPLACMAFATLGAIPLVVLFKQLQRGAVARKRRLIALLLERGLPDEARKVVAEVDNTRLLGVWRYASGLTLAGVRTHPALRSEVRSRWAVPQRFMKDMLPVYIVMSVFLYSSLIQRFASLVSCRRDQVTKILYHRVLSDVICDFRQSRDFRVLVVIAALCIAGWGVGFPMLCFFLLVRHRHELNHPDILQVYGFLHNGYAIRYWYWEVFFFMRKAAVPIAHVFTHSNVSYVHMNVLVSLVFFAFHTAVLPFDRRNNNILQHLDVAGLICWILSVGLSSIGVVCTSAESRLFVAATVIIVNAGYVCFVVQTLVMELFASARGASARVKQFPVIGLFIRFLARQDREHRYSEPRVLLMDRRNEVLLASVATQGSVCTRSNARRRRTFGRNPAAGGSGGEQSGKELALNSIELMRYPNGVPKPPQKLHQQHFIGYVVDTFIYFVNHLKTNKLHGEMFSYVTRIALASASLARTAEISEKKKLKTFANFDAAQEDNIARIVKALEAEKIQRQMAELDKLKQFQRELDAYYAGKEMSDLTFRTTVDVEDEQAHVLEGVSLPALFQDIGLRQTLPLSSFYAQLYQTFQQSEGNTQRFEQYRVYRYISDRAKQKDVSDKWSELVNLKAFLQEALATADWESHDFDRLAAINEEINVYASRIALLSQIIDFSSYRPLELAANLAKIEHDGFDPRAYQLLALKPPDKRRIPPPPSPASPANR